MTQGPGQAQETAREDTSTNPLTDDYRMKVQPFASL
jgi:hypothetical protein